jgi:hypothetical protein
VRSPSPAPVRAPSRIRAGAPFPQTGQASVELAVLLPVLLLMLLLVVQVGLVARDRVVAVHAVRVAARAAIVEPTEFASVEALRRHGLPLDRLAVSLEGDRSAGGLLSVVVVMRPTPVPLVGRVLSGVELTERLAVVVEGTG